MARTVAGVKASELLEACMASSLHAREAGVGAQAVGGGVSTGAPSARDQYFERTESVLDALVQLHTPGCVWFALLVLLCLLEL